MSYSGAASGARKPWFGMMRTQNIALRAGRRAKRRRPTAAHVRRPAVLQVFISRLDEFVGMEMFALDQGVIVGRHYVSDLRLDGDTISRRHARLSFQDGQILVQDLGSGNGTFVNHQKVQSQRSLTSSDTISIGPFQLRVRALNAETKKPFDVADCERPTKIEAILSGEQTGGTQQIGLNLENSAGSRLYEQALQRQTGAVRPLSVVEAPASEDDDSFAETEPAPETAASLRIVADTRSTSAFTHKNRLEPQRGQSKAASSALGPIPRQVSLIPKKMKPPPLPVPGGDEKPQKELSQESSKPNKARAPSAKNPPRPARKPSLAPGRNQSIAPQQTIEVGRTEVEVAQPIEDVPARTPTPIKMDPQVEARLRDLDDLIASLDSRHEGAHQASFVPWKEAEGDAQAIESASELVEAWSDSSSSLASDAFAPESSPNLPDRSLSTREFARNLASSLAVDGQIVPESLKSNWDSTQSEIDVEDDLGPPTVENSLDQVTEPAPKTPKIIEPDEDIGPPTVNNQALMEEPVRPAPTPKKVAPKKQNEARKLRQRRRAVLKETKKTPQSPPPLPIKPSRPAFDAPTKSEETPLPIPTQVPIRGEPQEVSLLTPTSMRVDVSPLKLKERGLSDVWSESSQPEHKTPAKKPSPAVYSGTVDSYKRPKPKVERHMSMVATPSMAMDDKSTAATREAAPPPPPLPQVSARKDLRFDGIEVSARANNQLIDIAVLRKNGEQYVLGHPTPQGSLAPGKAHLGLRLVRINEDRTVDLVFPCNVGGHLMRGETTVTFRELAEGRKYSSLRLQFGDLVTVILGEGRETISYHLKFLRRPKSVFGRIN